MDDEKIISEIVNESGDSGHPIDRSDIPVNAYTDVYRKEFKDVPKYTDPIKQREQ